MCALVSSSRLVFARSNLFCDLPFSLPLPGFGALRLRPCAHCHPPEYLVLLLAPRVGWCRKSSGTRTMRWVLVFTRGSGSLYISYILLSILYPILCVYSSPNLPSCPVLSPFLSAFIPTPTLSSLTSRGPTSKLALTLVCYRSTTSVPRAVRAPTY
jgi:hypothetical protein